MLRLLTDVDLLLAAVWWCNLVSICIVILTRSNIIDSRCSRSCVSVPVQTVLVTFPCCCSSARYCPRCWRRPFPCASPRWWPGLVLLRWIFLPAVVCAGPHEQPHQRKAAHKGERYRSTNWPCDAVDMTQSSRSRGSM